MRAEQKRSEETMPDHSQELVNHVNWTRLTTMTPRPFETVTISANTIRVPPVESKEFGARASWEVVGLGAGLSYDDACWDDDWGDDDEDGDEDGDVGLEDRQLSSTSVTDGLCRFEGRRVGAMTDEISSEPTGLYGTRIGDGIIAVTNEISSERMALDASRLDANRIVAGSIATHPGGGLPRCEVTIEGHPLNGPMERPVMLGGFLVLEGGIREGGEIYVTVHDGAEAHTLCTGTQKRLDDATARLETAQKLLDVTHRHSVERGEHIRELKDLLAEANARIAELTREAPEPDWTQPAEMAGMGRPRTGRGFNW